MKVCISMPEDVYNDVVVYKTKHKITSFSAACVEIITRITEDVTEVNA